MTGTAQNTNLDYERQDMDHLGWILFATVIGLSIGATLTNWISFILQDGSQRTHWNKMFEDQGVNLLCQKVFTFPT